MAEAVWRDGRSQLKRLKELEKENQRLRRAVSDLTLDKLISDRSCTGKLLSPSRRRKCIDHVRQELGVSERSRLPRLGAAPFDTEKGSARPC